MPIPVQKSEKITIEIDKETAQAYRAASAINQRKAQALLRFFFKDISERSREERLNSLFQVMDEISKESLKKGLTPEILEEIINEK